MSRFSERFSSERFDSEGNVFLMSSFFGSTPSGAILALDRLHREKTDPERGKEGGHTELVIVNV
jgi:hypothetical protein